MNVEVNYLAILLAGISNMILGFLWYSPMMFAKPWMKLMGFTKDSMEKAKNGMGMMYGISFVLALVMAYVLSHVMTLSQNFFQYDRLMTGLTTAFWMWLGFVMPVQATGAIFSGKTGQDVWKLFAINTGYQLVSLLIMGVVIALV